MTPRWLIIYDQLLKSLVTLPHAHANDYYGITLHSVETTEFYSQKIFRKNSVKTTLSRNKSQVHRNVKWFHEIFCREVNFCFFPHCAILITWHLCSFLVDASKKYQTLPFLILPMQKNIELSFFISGVVFCIDL